MAVAVSRHTVHLGLGRHACQLATVPPPAQLPICRRRMFPTNDHSPWYVAAVTKCRAVFSHMQT